MVRRGLEEWPELDASKSKDRGTARAAYQATQSERNKQDNQELRLTLEEALEAQSHIISVRSSAMCFLCMVCSFRLFV
jgi:hypothetical protein